jgi:hypothetical protein
LRTLKVLGTRIRELEDLQMEIAHEEPEVARLQERMLGVIAALRDEITGYLK